MVADFNTRFNNRSQHTISVTVSDTGFEEAFLEYCFKTQSSIVDFHCVNHRGWRLLSPGSTFASVRGDPLMPRKVPKGSFFSGIVFLSGLDYGLVFWRRACYRLVSPFLMSVDSPSDQRERWGG